MRVLAQNFLRPLGLLAALMRWRIRLSARRVGLIVCYHEVADHGGDLARELVPAVGIKLFRGQLKHLNHSYRVVPLDDLLEATKRRSRGQPLPVSITFDDDLPSHVAKAMPELKRLGVPASFFVCGGSLREPFSYWWEDLQRHVDAGGDVLAMGASDIHDLARTIARLAPSEHEKFASMLKRVAPSTPRSAGLRAADVRALAEEGFQVGFHTRRHYLLTTLDDEQLEHALHDGCDEVASVAGQPVTAIAFPHGAADARVADAARKTGYGWGLTVGRNPVGPYSDRLLLSRIEASPRSLGQFAFDLAQAAVRHPDGEDW